MTTRYDEICLLAWHRVSSRTQFVQMQTLQKEVIVASILLFEEEKDILQGVSNPKSDQTDIRKLAS